VSSTDLKNLASIPLPATGKGFETFILRSKLGTFLPLFDVERGWGEVHRTHVNLNKKPGLTILSQLIGGA
jgi:hypothetical protein